MDDVEKAILFSFDESGAVNPSLKSQAAAYCNQLKQSPAICLLCIDRLSFTKFVQVQFWCLQTLHESLRLRYASLPPDEKAHIRNALFSIATPAPDSQSATSMMLLNSPTFIKNKFAQVYVTLIYFEYPLIWSSAFLDLLARLADGPLVIDVFCRILNSLDDELISLDYPRTPDEMAAATRIKDSMRQQCVPQIVRAWYDIVLSYNNSDPNLATSVLDTMRRYVTWIDIGLIANDAFIPLLFKLILLDGQPENLRAASAGCVLAVVLKRMDPQSKISLLRSLQISRVFSLVAGDSDSELVTQLAALVTGYAAELLDCSKRLDSGDLKGISLELLDEVLPTVFYVMQNCELDSAFNVVQFLSNYVATMKSALPLREEQIVRVGQVLEVIRARICYDQTYRDNLNLPDKIGREEEDWMMEYRKDLFVLLRTVARVAPDVTQLFIRNLLASAIGSSEGAVEEVEAALSLFYALGESIGEEGIRACSGHLGEIVPMLLSARFSCHSHRLVALVYLETVTRYVKFILENEQYIPLMLSAFLDERGIHHPNPNVSRRASYLFMRVVKLLRIKLVPFIDTILQAIGLLIGMEDVPPEKQSEYLSALLTPLCQQVESLLRDAKVQGLEEASTKVAGIQQVIMAINALSKVLLLILCNRVLLIEQVTVAIIVIPMTNKEKK
ncbi:hypothetical protein ACLOJK_034681 [Asimina triloba]